jgi:catechol-2,3-dioxygenase
MPGPTWQAAIRSSSQKDLTKLGIPHQLWDHGICDSLYLEDPEGHQIELTTYRS